MEKAGKKLQTHKMGRKWGFHLILWSECFGDLRIQQHFGKLKISFRMGTENTNLSFFLKEKIVERCFRCWGGLIQKQLNSEMILEFISPIELSVR